MKREEFVNRRKAIRKDLVDGDVFLLFSGVGIRKSADEDYPFFANRNFLYMTGIRQVNSVLYMERQEGAVTEKMYMDEPNDSAEIWHGRRMRPDEVECASGIREICPVESLQNDLNRQLRTGLVKRVWLCLDTLTPNQTEDLEHRFARFLRTTYPDVVILNSYYPICSMRRYKSEEEINAIRRGMNITAAGIRAAMTMCRPGMMEYELEGAFLYELARRGQRFPAFPSIVAAGNRIFYLHYPNPMQKIEDGDLVLVDVGAACEGYCTDISRVFPANGVFSEKQKQIYEIAYKANRAIIDKIRPGQPFTMPNSVCREVAFDGLKKLGLIDSFDHIRDFVWHGTTHYIGLDTHDVGSYTDPMAPGMVFTVDAGIYVREWDLGLRIEDDVLVTETGCELLSSNIPAEPEEIEDLMHSN